MDKAIYKFQVYHISNENIHPLLYYASEKTVSVLKNAVFWDVTPHGSCKKGHFGGT
jgi:hypothetical protein